MATNKVSRAEVAQLGRSLSQLGEPKPRKKLPPAVRKVHPTEHRDPESGYLREACAYVPAQHVHRAVTNVLEYLLGTQPNGSRPAGAPEIAGYKLLDDRGGTCTFQLRVAELTPAQLKKIVGPDIDVTWEHV